MRAAPAQQGKAREPGPHLTELVCALPRCKEPLPRRLGRCSSSRLLVGATHSAPQSLRAWHCRHCTRAHLCQLGLHSVCVLALNVCHTGR